MCDESLIQNPIVKPKYIGKAIMQTSYCPLCDKELMFYVKNRRTAGFIVTKIGETK
jgi:hypothetical protein